jgi:hypothetical protein
MVGSKFIFRLILNCFSLTTTQKHEGIYPTLACIARDICAIPASSVPCERLFPAAAEIATDCHSRLGAVKFEYLQVLKHTWRNPSKTLQASIPVR